MKVNYTYFVVYNAVIFCPDHVRRVIAVCREIELQRKNSTAVCIGISNTFPHTKNPKQYSRRLERAAEALFHGAGLNFGNIADMWHGGSASLDVPMSKRPVETCLNMYKHMNRGGESYRHAPVHTRGGRFA